MVYLIIVGRNPAMLFGGVSLTLGLHNSKESEKINTKFSSLENILCPVPNAQMLPSKERFGFLYNIGWLAMVLS